MPEARLQRTRDVYATRDASKELLLDVFEPWTRARARVYNVLLDAMRKMHPDDRFLFTHPWILKVDDALPIIEQSDAEWLMRKNFGSRSLLTLRQLFKPYMKK